MLDTLKNATTTIHIICDDTDVFVVMVSWCWKQEQHVVYKRRNGMEKSLI